MGERELERGASRALDAAPDRVTRRCGLCDGARLNGAAVRPVDPDDRAGAWQVSHSHHPDAVNACRPCARDVVAGDWSSVDRRAGGEA